MKIIFKACIIAVLLFSAIGFYGFESAHLLTVVKTDAGQVSGVPNKAGDVVAFKGIPFAAPPVGALRWKAPQPVPHWKGVKKCDDFGPSPMQPKPIPFAVYTKEFLIPETPISEDCLYLNIWTGARSEREKKPVFVWIYGGGFTSGGSACAIYDGEAMAKKGVVFVSINYRVGVFGFFAHPDLAKESPEKVSGNYGILDQIAALKWIKKNIAAFGGDPDNVTIAGQSAGSMSVNVLVASPLGKHLFHKAIAESGSMLSKTVLIGSATLADAQREGQRVAEKAGVQTVEQMRSMSGDELLKKFNGRYAPIVDGYVLPAPVADIFAKNEENHVPLITGWNKDDAFVGLKNREAFLSDVRKEYGQNAAKFLQYFPANTQEQADRSQIDLNRDQMFALSGYRWASIQSEYKDSPVYLYNFARNVPAKPEFVKYGAFHTAEVPYALADLKFLNRPLQAVDYKLSDIMSSYWVNFAKTGNPNGNGLPIWPKFDTRTDKVMWLDQQPKAVTLPSKASLDYLLGPAAE